MPWPERPLSPRILSALLIQEVRSLLLSPALWLLLTVLSILVGSSFLQAVQLYSQASQTALSYPELARGMDPLEGIFIPTFGAYYLAETLLLPFIAIRLTGLDKTWGTRKLLLQLGPSPLTLCGLKVVAMAFVWLLSLLPALLVLLLWHRMGGHIHLPAMVSLVTGHALYTLLVITVAMFSGAISNSLPTAAMLCLSFTLGSWVLDFSGLGHTRLPGMLDTFFPIKMLRQLESGLITLDHLGVLLLAGLLFFLLTVAWYHPGQKRLACLLRSLAVLVIVAGLAILWSQVPGYLDLTEQKKHSFNPAVTRALQQLDDHLTITVHLDRQDSRLKDLEQNIFSRLRRSVPHLTIRYGGTQSTALFAAAEDDSYGLIEYRYQGRSTRSYSNSEQEILAIVFDLAGLQVQAAADQVYPGYPLVADAGAGRWWLDLVLPLLFMGSGFFCRRIF